MLFIISLIGILVAICFQMALIPELTTEFYTYTNLGLWAVTAVLAVIGIVRSKGQRVKIQGYEKQALEQADLQTQLRTEIANESANRERLEKRHSEMSARLSAHEQLLSEARADSDMKNDRLKQLQAELKIAQANDSEQTVMAVLSSLQKHGRFLDFVMGDISALPDERVGAAARVVHQGCSGILNQYFDFKPVFENQEGSDVTIDENSDRSEFRLLGGEARDLPATARLVHKGWRTDKVNLPQKIEASSPGKNVIVPAELQLHDSP